MKELIRAKAKEFGFDACGFAAAAQPRYALEFAGWLEAGHHGQMHYLERNAGKRLDLQAVLPGAKSVICLAASYGGYEPQPPLASAGSSGLVARYARYADYHKVLGEKIEVLARFIAGLGDSRTQSLGYVDTGPVLERDVAERAGLGFIGKHTNLISRQLGNWILLGEIITSLEIPADPSEKNRCGSCSRCLAACPTAAIRAPFQLDARRCISYLTIELKGSIPLEFRPAIHNRIFGCDDCLAVCPWNRFAKEGRMMRAHARDDLAQPDLVRLIALDEPEFKRRFADTPLSRVKYRGFQRNVCVALGNVGDAQALPALRRAAAGADPLVAEHAAWAIGQIETGRRRVES